jgi:hypothetical protein
MGKFLHKLLFGGVALLFNLVLTSNVAGATIAGFTPSTITAGTGNILTITGTGFGTGGPSNTQFVQFTSASVLVVQPLISDYISWSDTQIKVKVPTDAGTGVISVTNGNTVVTTTGVLTVTYDMKTVPYNGVAYPARLVNTNSAGGYNFQMSSGFSANTNAGQLFTLALKTWRCATSVNWNIGAVTNVNIAANDGVNVVRFASPTDNLDDGLLGQATAFYSSRDGVRWEAVDIDITFAAPTTINWNFSTNAPGSSQFDFTTAALHELGHTHMLGHVNDSTDVMFANIGAGTAIRTLNTNDINAGNYTMQLSTAAATNTVFPVMTPSTAGGCAIPTIASFAPTTGNTGTAVTITGTNLSNATGVAFGGIPATSFTVVSPTSITAVVGAGASGSAAVNSISGTASLGGFTYVYSLPPNNFQLAITSATCKGSANGQVVITAAQPLAYTATIIGPGVNSAYAFNNTQTINNLAAGSYSICITVSGQPTYSQCFTAVITEPKDITLYSTVNLGTFNSLSLVLTGGTQYNIQLNGDTYTTTSGNITLPLKDGVNNLAVTTDKPCQGTILKTYNISNNLVPYPDPFVSTLNLNLGLDNVPNVAVEIQGLNDGKLVFNKGYANQSGVLQLDLSNLGSGLYVLKVTMGNTEKIFKILKK